MSLHFREIAADAARDGIINADEILALRQSCWADGKIDPDEAEALFETNDRLIDRPIAWCDFFVEALSNFVVHTVEPVGYVDQTMADELVARIDRDGRVCSMTELDLLVTVMERATSVPPSLRAYALRQIEDAVLTGEGPTRNSQLQSQSVNAAECQLLRRMIFGAAGDRPAAVSGPEAEALFRIKDAALYEVNAPEWEMLFVQGVANYLLGFAGEEPLPAPRVAELERFMATEGNGIGGFLHRMITADVDSGFGSLLTLAPDASENSDEALAEIDPAKASWLHDLLDADEELDPMEKALLAFIAEETGEVFGVKV